MGVKDGFTGASLLVKIAFFVALAANFCSWLSFTTTSWTVVDGLGVNADMHYGLWRSCSSRVASCNLWDGTGNTSFGAVQAFAIFGYVGINVGFLLIVLYMFWDSCKQNAEVGLASAIVLIVAAVMWLIAVITYGVDIFNDNAITDLGYSFVFAIIALLLALVAGILMIVAGKGGSVGSK